jgi:hypothetical protein
MRGSRTTYLSDDQNLGQVLCAWLAPVQMAQFSFGPGSLLGDFGAPSQVRVIECSWALGRVSNGRRRDGEQGDAEKGLETLRLDAVRMRRAARAGRGEERPMQGQGGVLFACALKLGQIRSKVWHEVRR